MSKLKWNLLSAEHYFSLKKVAAGSTSCKQALEQKMSGERIKEISERERGLEKTGMIFLSLKAVLLVKTQLISEELPHIYSSMRPRDQVCSRGIYFIICTILVFFSLAFFFGHFHGCQKNYNE